MAVVVPITADFDPAGIKAADAAFKSFGQNLSRTLNQASRLAASSLGTVEDAANDTRTAAQRLAAAIDKTTAGLSADIEKSAAAARALADALGPDMAAKIGRNGLQTLIRDFTRMGLTLEDVTNEAETLAASVRQIEGLSVDPLNTSVTQLDDGVRRVGDTTDRTRSVFANFVGNASQELPGIGAAFGPLNTAIGQFAEYASEGNIGLANLAKFVGPIAAIGVGFYALSSALQASAERSKLLAENVEVVSTALYEGRNAVDELYDKLREGQEIKTFDSDSGPFGDVVDIEKDLYKLGLPLDLLESVAKRGIPAIEDYVKGLEAAYENLRTLEVTTGKAQDKTQSYKRVIQFLNAQIKELTKGEADAAQRTFVYGLAQTEAEKATLDAANAVAYSRVELTGLGSAIDSAAFAQREFEKRMADVRAESERTANAIDQARKQFFRFLDLEKNEKELAEQTATARNELAKARKRANAKEIVEAEERLLEAIQNEGEALATAYLETSKVKDEKVKQSLATGALIGYLKQQAEVLGPNSPAVRNLLEWIRILEQDVPKDLTTNVLVNYTGVISTTGTQGLGGLRPPPQSPFGAGGINISVQSLDPETSAKLVARTMNEAADRQGRERPFPWQN